MQAATGSQTARVLIIDDQTCIAQAVACLLAEACGAEVQVASRGEQALALAATLRPHLVLVDVQMPGLPPLELCRRLRQVPGLETVPFYLFTGLLPDNAELGELLGQVQGVINKPPDPGELLAVLAGAVAQP